MKKDIIQTAKVVILSLVLTLGINFVFATTWTGPTATPPLNNTDTPINVGATGQTKTGALTIGDYLSVLGNGYFQVLGVNDATPDGGLTLDVNGKIGATEYCDENGLNCTAAGNLGGSLGAIYEVTNAYSVDEVGTLTTQSTTETRQCGNAGPNDDACYYTCAGGCITWDYMGLPNCINRFAPETCSNTAF